MSAIKIFLLADMHIWNTECGQYSIPDFYKSIYFDKTKYKGTEWVALLSTIPTAVKS